MLALVEEKVGVSLHVFLGVDPVPKLLEHLVPTFLVMVGSRTANSLSRQASFGIWSGVSVRRENFTAQESGCSTRKPPALSGGVTVRPLTR